jgi:hypothetical protein
MKTLFIACICSVALALVAFGQNPTATQATSPAPATSMAPAPAATAASANDLADKIQQRIEKKFKKGAHIRVGTDSDATPDRHEESGDIPPQVIPIVAISVLAVFGAPVLIVAVIMYFGFSKNRMMHRTIRMMVEKGQPVPAALLAPSAPAQRQRSDMRRGVVLVMVGLGLMLFLGAVNDWEGGVWSLGIIPFLIGAGYLLVWKLEGKKDIPPLPPAQ